MGTEYLIALDIELKEQDEDLLFDIEDACLTPLEEAGMEETSFGLHGRWNKETLYLLHQGELTYDGYHSLLADLKAVVAMYKDWLSSAELRTLDLEHDGDSEALV